ncbi:MAG: polyprenol monophosphomannose synthase [Winogradskyella sp.]|uniref:polyprenol monophosphomannose synthase n=1 Tax=Winogradskyella sp. TaxID=1883156 RepID=UPI000F3CD427|nr:polyprenol monophosphomannose synthase [Winogradskyella sp.]RNC87787.1 MAG: polyprenol monophosphomannose synthase [Winogradskyella sp.]
MTDAIVIIPTYNEKENIKEIIEVVFSLPEDFHVLVVDDNSPDGTAQIVKTLQKNSQNKVHLIQRKEKNGLGTAYIEGFKWCLAKHYKFIFEMDADFSHNPIDLIKLYEAAAQDNADVVIGSRYIKGVNVVNWPLMRILLSYGASLYVKLITGMRVQDPTAGFVCYRREVLEEINLDKIKFIGYAFQIEMKFKAYKKGFKIIEIPIIFTDRIRGKSKMSGGIISEAIFGVISMKWNSLFKKD